MSETEMKESNGERICVQCIVYKYESVKNYIRSKIRIGDPRSSIAGVRSVV